MIYYDRLNNVKNNLAARAIATGLAASALVGLGIGADELSRSHDLSKKEQIQLAQDEAYGAINAQKKAEYYTTQLNSDKREIINMQVLHGTVYEKSANGKSTPEFKNPILLGLHSETGKADYDAKGDFLVGGYLGLASNDIDNKIKITVVPYGYDEVSFKPDDPANLVINPTVINESGKNGSVLYGYDVNKHQTMTNADGSAFVIGELVGRK